MRKRAAVNNTVPEPVRACSHPKKYFHKNHFRIILSYPSSFKEVSPKEPTASFLISLLQEH
jgi:hypothetical protein